MKKIPSITVQNLDHLGLVAGIIDRIQIVEKINQLVGCQRGEIVSPGHAVFRHDSQRIRFSISTVIFILKIF